MFDLCKILFLFKFIPDGISQVIISPVTSQVSIYDLDPPELFIMTTKFDICDE
jgi:hypothetical protein